MKKLFSLILASTMAFGLVACGGGTSTSNTTTAANKDTMAASEEDSSANKDASSEAKSYRIIYVDPAAANPYWVDVASGIQAAAKDLGITVEMSGVDQINHIKQKLSLLLQIIQMASLQWHRTLSPLRLL